MKITVHKFGGSILRDTESVRQVAQTIQALYLQGEGPVVVASALSGKTNHLLKLAHTYAPAPDSRELDMLLCSGEQEAIALLAMVLKSMGVPAVSRNASQVKITTDATHLEASLKTINTEQIQSDLKDQKVPIIAGFQGISPTGDPTTLGRGGSDLTAIALAHALGAQACKIYTDVHGIYTSNPQHVEAAMIHKHLPYDIMLEMATCGAHVMQAKAVAFAKGQHRPFEVLSLQGQTGTQVGHYTLCPKTLFAIQAEDHLLQYRIRSDTTQEPLIFKILESFSDAAIALKSFSTDYTSGKTTLITCKQSQEHLAEPLLIETLKKHASKAQLLKEAVSQIHLIHGPEWPAPRALKRIHQDLSASGLQVKTILSERLRTSLTLRPHHTGHGVKLLHKTLQLDVPTTPIPIPHDASPRNPL